MTSNRYRNLPFLLFAVPPDIDDSATSGDITIKEGENVTFTCSATGHPEPRILWRREDGSHLVIQTAPHETQKGIIALFLTITCVLCFGNVSGRNDNMLLLLLLKARTF